MLIRRFIWVTVLAVLLVSGVNSQPNFRSQEIRSSGFSLNLNWLQLTDNTFSPLRYNGPGIDLRILSVRDYNQMRRHLQIGARGDYLWNRLDFTSYYFQPSFIWGLTFLIPDLSADNASSFFGGSLNATSRIYRFNNEDPERIYWTTSYSLDLNYLFDLEINRDRFMFVEIRVPVAAAVSRPSDEINYTYQLPGFGEYIKRLHENIGFATLDKLQSANLKIIMDLSRSRRSSFSIGYEVDFFRFAGTEQVMYLSNSLLLRMYIDALVW